MKDLGEEMVAHIGENSFDGTRLAWKKHYKKKTYLQNGKCSL